MSGERPPCTHRICSSINCRETTRAQNTQHPPSPGAPGEPAQLTTSTGPTQTSCWRCFCGVCTYSCYCEHVEDFGTVSPGVCVPVFGLALVCWRECFYSSWITGKQAAQAEQTLTAEPAHSGVSQEPCQEPWAGSCCWLGPAPAAGGTEHLMFCLCLCS